MLKTFKLLLIGIESAEMAPWNRLHVGFMLLFVNNAGRNEKRPWLHGNIFASGRYKQAGTNNINWGNNRNEHTPTTHLFYKYSVQFCPGIFGHNKPTCD